MLLNTYLPLGSAIVTFVFAALVFRRWRDRPSAYLLLWGIGLTFYAMGALMEALFGVFGWHPVIFRAWYLFGAVLVAAWLGQGTAYLLVRRTIGGIRVAHLLMGVLIAGSLFAAARVLTADLDPANMIGNELSGHAIVTPGVRSLTPFFNLYGVLLLVGGALYSAFVFWRKRIFRNRTVGNIFIALGAMMPGFGGSLQRYGTPGALYIGEFIGAVLMFVGFLYATRPEPAPLAGEQARAAPA